MSSSTDVSSLLVQAAVPGFKCPTGTKMHILDLGTLEADESWYVDSIECPLGSLELVRIFTRYQDSSW
jgi:hypothetical protein